MRADIKIRQGRRALATAPTIEFECLAREECCIPRQGLALEIEWLDCRVEGFYGCKIGRNFCVDNGIDDGQPRFRERGKLSFRPIGPVRVLFKQVDHTLLSTNTRVGTA